jgi:GNAT superfamily N-acetyltransferase
LSTGEVRVRAMVEEDAEAVAELVGELGYERTSEEARRWIAELDGREEEQAAFVACVGGEVVGWIEASIERRLQSERYALIGGLVVKDGVRGRGAGRMLCERVEEWGRERGVRKVRVTSRSTREGAHRFYQRDGYVQVKTSLVFEKRLAD